MFSHLKASVVVISFILGPSTKLQLLQPGQLQRRSLAVSRGKSTGLGQSGPLKATAPPAPAQTGPKLGDTVERPCKTCWSLITNCNAYASI